MSKGSKEGKKSVKAIIIIPAAVFVLILGSLFLIRPIKGLIDKHKESSSESAEVITNESQKPTAPDPKDQVESNSYIQEDKSSITEVETTSTDSKTTEKSGSSTVEQSNAHETTKANATSVDKSKKVEVPMIQGKTETYARSTLENIGFKVKTEYIYSDDTGSGLVDRQDPEPGYLAKEGQTVTIVVSKGPDKNTSPQKITVPNVIGDSESTAVNKLRNSGFNCNVSYEYYNSSSVNVGSVFKQSPSTAYKGDTINLVVSKGAQRITVSLDPNGGTTSTNSKIVYRDGTYGVMPAPSRKYYNFSGWYTSSVGGTEVTSSTIVTKSDNHTLYAHWTEKPASGWSDTVPAGAKISDQKKQWRYRDKQTTTNTSTSMSGWEQNGVANTSYSSWSGNKSSTTRPTTSDTLQIVDQYTTYNYYHYCNYYDNQWNTDSIACGSSSQYHSFSTTAPLPDCPDNILGADQGGRLSEARGWRNGSPKHSCGVHDKWIWWLESTTTTYIYQTRTKTVTYNYWRWGNWSSWSDSQYFSSNTRQVETRTLYRYISD